MDATIDNLLNTMNSFFLIALPYIALVVCIVGTIWRYRQTKFKVSSLSSQFLEGRTLFWGSVPFHWGILVLFLGHLIGFLFPRGVLLWNSHPARLIIIEISAFIFALAVLVGLLNLIYRRLTNRKVMVVTSKMDIFILLLLLLLVVSGLWIAYFFRWGSSWFASVITPYLRSIFMFQPDIAAVSTFPWIVKLHMISAYVLFMIIPFSRLVHFLVIPLDYIWRPYQQVYWNWNRKNIRDAGTTWAEKRPKNN